MPSATRLEVPPFSRQSEWTHLLSSGTLANGHMGEQQGTIHRETSEPVPTRTDYQVKNNVNGILVIMLLFILQSGLETYNMQSNPTGLCLIIDCIGNDASGCSNLSFTL